MTLVLLLVCMVSLQCYQHLAKAEEQDSTVQTVLNQSNLAGEPAASVTPNAATYVAKVDVGTMSVATAPTGWVLVNDSTQMYQKTFNESTTYASVEAEWQTLIDAYKTGRTYT